MRNSLYYSLYYYYSCYYYYYYFFPVKLFQSFIQQETLFSRLRNFSFSPSFVQMKYFQSNSFSFPQKIVNRVGVGFSLISRREQLQVCQICTLFWSWDCQQTARKKGKIYKKKTYIWQQQANDVIVWLSCSCTIVSQMT